MMPYEEEKIKSLVKSVGLILFMLLLTSYFDSQTVIILLLSMIYLKLRN